MKTHKSPILLLIFIFYATLDITAYATTIIDQSGQTIEFSKPFTRIISLYAAHTENLYALGLEKEIIGVSKHDNFPPQMTSKPKFHYRDDPEKFIAAHPDLVLIRPMIARSYPNLIQKLHLAGITVVSLQPTSINETYEYWHKLGVLCNRQQMAQKMVTRFKHQLKKISLLVHTIPPNQRKTVYFEAIHRRMKTFAPTSMAIFCLNIAGGLNAAPDAKTVRKSNIAAYGKEHILAKAETIDVFLAQIGRMNQITLTDIQHEPGFQAIKAVRNGQVHLISEELVSRPTMRLLEGIRQIGQILYPDKFKAISGI